MPDKSGWEMRREVTYIPHELPWATGRFYQCPFALLLATGGGGAAFTTLTLTPFWVPNPAGVTVTSLSVNVTTGGAASTVRLGIYGTDSNGRPGKLIVDGGTAATTTSSAAASVTISQFLHQGWYFAGYAMDGTGSPTITTILSYRRHGVGSSDGSNQAFDAVFQASSLSSGMIAQNGLPDWPAQVSPSQGTVGRVLVGI